MEGSIHALIHFRTLEVFLLANPRVVSSVLAKCDCAAGLARQMEHRVVTRAWCPLRRRYSSMGGPTMPDPNGSTTVDSSSSDKPTSLGKSSSTPPGEKKVNMRIRALH